jgi:hypothetical protein
MLKTILGSAIGGLTAGAVALGVSAFARPAAGPVTGVDPNNPYAMTVAYPGGPAQMTPGVTPGMMPAGYYAPQPVYYAPQPAASDIVSMPAPQARPVVRTVTRPAATRERVVYREEDRREGRSWGKTAMIIGGGAGGGAGIGGLIGGKKGALIGAAIGGGAATIYESTKR